MRVMVLIKATRKSEAGEMPKQELLAEMASYNEELVQAGVLLAGDGLKPSKHGKRVRFSGADKSVTDGPFPDVSGVIAGYWIWQVRSMQEALDWVHRCPPPMPGEESEIEIRPLFEAEDFGAELTPELREQEERMRREVQTRGSSAPPVH